jgi:N-acetylneuraminic acid mutarotase
MPDPSAGTWAYDPAANTWTELKPSGTVPPARFAAAMAYDPTTRRLILFGGYAKLNTGPQLGDAWAYDSAANTWTELEPAGTVPPGRVWHAMAYDPSTGRIIMFGGHTNDGSKSFGDTWAYDPVANTWTELKPLGTVPPGLLDDVVAYDPISRRLIFFGGFDRPRSQINGEWVMPDPSAGTWAYDPAANTWTELKPAGVVPPARWAALLDYTPSTGQIVMFGGVSAVGDPLNDTWAFTP